MVSHIAYESDANTGHLRTFPELSSPRPHTLSYLWAHQQANQHRELAFQNGLALMVACEKLGNSDTKTDKPFEMKRHYIILVLKKSRFDVNNAVQVKFMS